jgi:hypothetical protein
MVVTQDKQAQSKANSTEFKASEATEAKAASNLKPVFASELQHLRNALDKVKLGLQSIQQRSRPFTMDNLKPYQNLLLEIERSQMGDGAVFGGWVKAEGFSGQGSYIPAGQAQLRELFDSCHDLVTKLTKAARDAQPSKEEVHKMKKQDKAKKRVQSQVANAKSNLHTVVGVKVQPIKEELESILMGLRVIQQKTSHTFDDMAALQKRLHAIEEKRDSSNATFQSHTHKDGSTTHIPAGQALLSELLAECHDVVEDLTNSAKDSYGDLTGLKTVVDAQLQPVLEKLRAVKLALNRMATQQPFELGSLSKVQSSVDEIETTFTVNGIFQLKGSSAIPAGQAILKGALDECHELIQQLQQLTTGE